MRHELKTWPVFFNDVAAGRKSFEVRKNDRDFKVGDILYLREYDNNTANYTGITIEVTVSYVLLGPTFGIESGFCVMGILTDLPF